MVTTVDAACIRTELNSLQCLDIILRLGSGSKSKMASTLEHFVIATLLALLALTNKEKLRKYWHTREDDALIGLDVATDGVKPGFAKVAVG